MDGVQAELAQRAGDDANYPAGKMESLGEGMSSQASSWCQSSSAEPGAGHPPERSRTTSGGQ